MHRIAIFACIISRVNIYFGKITQVFTGIVAAFQKMWPKLESFDIRWCAGLTMSTLSSIVPQLIKLKELSLPEKIAKSDPKLAADIWEDLSYRTSPVLLRFKKSFLYAEPCPCLFLPDADQELLNSELESDGDEISAASTEWVSSEDDGVYFSSNTDSS